MSEREDVLTLVDEEGNEHLFTVIDLLKVENREYAILLPLDQEEEEEAPGDEAIIFRVVEDDQGQALMAVEDEEEWEEVAAAWEERNSEMEGE
ncbi:MAG: DUF1292 domain-containing protein [Candidatus Syntrophonatronum acetioxidans]|uniref:UPF0473 protein D5R97_01750 n=1 Tax=Candidatus Syntrophonatronum acetioxidans TaxID=1795816 RepID=A0A424YHR7_9FIRM|nr:MAG: DUF1292 domain-containing protein [Candidatus Syntrophonatronum acetioxidans]